MQQILLLRVAPGLGTGTYMQYPQLRLAWEDRLLCSWGASKGKHKA